MGRPPRPVTTDASVPHSAAAGPARPPRWSADAHIAEHHQIRTGVRLLVRDRDPRPERGLGLLRSQRVLDVDPPRPAPYPMPYDLRGQLLRIAVQRHVDDPYLHAEPARQHRRGARALQDRPHQLVGGARGPRRHTESGDPVVAREQHHARVLDRPHRHRGLRRRRRSPSSSRRPQRPGRHDLTLPARLGVPGARLRSIRW